jgi:hypothetical protein
MPKTTAIVLTATTISLTREPVANNVPDIINAHTITTVSGVFNKKPNNGELAHGVVVGAFEVGETITGGTSGATAVIAGFKNTVILNLSDIDESAGAFVAGETITGGTSAATATVSAAVVPTSYDGEWIYPYPTMTILQVEKNDHSKMAIELQDVSNQATWSDGTLTGLQTAIAAIEAIL